MLNSLRMIVHNCGILDTAQNSYLQFPPTITTRMSYVGRDGDSHWYARVCERKWSWSLMCRRRLTCRVIRIAYFVAWEVGLQEACQRVTSCRSSWRRLPAYCVPLYRNYLRRQGAPLPRARPQTTACRRERRMYRLLGPCGSVSNSTVQYNVAYVTCLYDKCDGLVSTIWLVMGHHGVWLLTARWWE